LGAFRAPAFGCFRATGHFDSFPVDQRICDLAPGFVKVPPRGLAGDSQSLGSLFLFQAFEIDKANQLNLLRFE
jgi:hypothetical protein